MTGWDANGMEREPFDGTFETLPPTRGRRYRHEGHGPRCSSNPTVGCVCGASEEEGDDVPYADR